MRVLLTFWVFLGAVYIRAAVKPDHIMQDPQARVFQTITEEEMQTRFGAQMALYMQALRPVNAVNGKGTLRIRPPRGGKRRTEPVQFRTFSIGNALVNQYTVATGTLTVRAQVGKDTEYQWVDSKQVSKKLSDTEAMTPFAGADFWIADLGLEMLRWPNQKVVERKLRRGELCSVLVSRPAKILPGGYSKVVSWVDEDSMGIVRAELFDADGKLLKIFEPKAFKKIDGQWHLKEMEMRNEQAGSRTAIVFELESAPKP